MALGRPAPAPRASVSVSSTAISCLLVPVHLAEPWASPLEPAFPGPQEGGEELAHPCLSPLSPSLPGSPCARQDSSGTGLSVCPAAILCPGRSGACHPFPLFPRGYLREIWVSSWFGLAFLTCVSCVCESFRVLTKSTHMNLGCWHLRAVVSDVWERSAMPPATRVTACT